MLPFLEDTLPLWKNTLVLYFPMYLFSHLFTSLTSFFCQQQGEYRTPALSLYVFLAILRFCSLQICESISFSFKPHFCFPSPFFSRASWINIWPQPSKQVNSSHRYNNSQERHTRAFNTRMRSQCEPWSLILEWFG